MVKSISLILLAAFSPAAMAFDPLDLGGAIGDGLSKVNPWGSSTTTNPAVVPPEPQSPCDGKSIRPDSAGNYVFSMEAGGASSYAIEFSKNGMNWSDPINGAMGVAQVQGQQIPVNVGKLLMVDKNWHWRTRGGSPNVSSKKSCKIAIEPSGGTQMLTPPILVSPACSSKAMGGTVVFDAKPGGGTFQVFRAELQYSPMGGGLPGNWANSGLITAIDKNFNKFGVVVPVSELAKHSGKWRWRARLAHEQMPLFGNVSQGEWSPWCEFSVPVTSQSAVGGATAPLSTLPIPAMPLPVPAVGSSPMAPPVVPPGSAQPASRLPTLPAVQQPPIPNQRTR